MNKENEVFNLTPVYCKAHPSKKAKYKIIGLPQQRQLRYNFGDLICSKCAIELQSQQYKVNDQVLQQIQELRKDQAEIRWEQIQNVIETIQNCFLLLDSNEQYLLDKQEEIIGFIEKQKMQVKEHYRVITQALDNKLKEQIDILNEYQQNTLEIYMKRIGETKSFHTELTQIYSDIEVNIERITKSMEEINFKTIIGGYSKRIVDIERLIQRQETAQVVIGQVYSRTTDQVILGGLIDDTTIEIKPVQTPLLKNPNSTKHKHSMSRMLSPQSTQVTSTPTNQTPDKSRSNSQQSKFQEILNKVNETQIETNNYYSQLLKKDQKPYNTSERYCSPSFKQ